MSHYNGTSSTPHSLFSSPCTMWIHSRQPRLHLREERAGRRGGGGGAGGGGRGAPLRSRPRPPAALTPAAHPARGRKAVARVGAAGRRALGEPRQPGPVPARPPGPSALGLFHWRTLPKMVICVRGRECGFPRFRVTWRERDSLARSQACRGLPPASPPPRHTHRPGKGRGAGHPRAAARASAPAFKK